MVNQAAPDGMTRVQGLLERIEHEAGMGRARHPPADDVPRKGVDHERDIDKAGPGRDGG